MATDDKPVEKLAEELYDVWDEEFASQAPHLGRLGPFSELNPQTKNSWYAVARDVLSR